MPPSLPRLPSIAVRAPVLARTFGDSGNLQQVGAYDLAAQNAAYLAAYAAKNTKLASPPAGTKWVASGGSDSNDGSYGAPYATIGKAIDNIHATDKCVGIRGTGRFVGTANFISSDHYTIPSGSAGNWTTIFAEVPFGVEIGFDSYPSYGDCPVKIASNYVHVHGIGVDQTFDTVSTEDGNDDYCFALNGDHNWLSCWYGRRKSVDRYGGHVWIGGGTGYVLVEDGFFNGATRYGIQGGSAGLSNPCGNKVVRRCIGILSFGLMKEPTAMFNFYGSNDGAYAQVKDMLWANCAGFDSEKLPHGTNDGYHYGLFYHPKSVRNVRHIGCFGVRCGAEYGLFRADCFGTGTGYTPMTAVDCFAGGMSAGLPMFSKNGEGTISLDYITMLNNSGNVVYDSGTPTWSVAHTLTSGILYPMKRVGGVGAQVLYPVGGVGRFWGDTGYDTEDTTLKLWPWPFEDSGAALFARQVTKPTSALGASITPNPFTGTSALSGLAKSITTEAFEMGGQPMPNLAVGAGVY